MTSFSELMLGVRVNHYQLAMTLRKSYKNALYWYDGAEAPGPDAPAVERFAYSQRDHLEKIMAELGVEYRDLDRDPSTSVAPPEGSGDADDA